MCALNCQWSFKRTRNPSCLDSSDLYTTTCFPTELYATLPFHSGHICFQVWHNREITSIWMLVQDTLLLTWKFMLSKFSKTNLCTNLHQCYHPTLFLLLHRHKIKNIFLTKFRGNNCKELKCSLRSSYHCGYIQEARKYSFLHTNLGSGCVVNLTLWSINPHK
jgi:hypothetical protein